jgi:hypothetical protein
MENEADKKKLIEEIKEEGHDATEDELEGMEPGTNEGGFEESGPSEGDEVEETDGVMEDNLTSGQEN